MSRLLLLLTTVALMALALTTSTAKPPPPWLSGRPCREVAGGRAFHCRGGLADPAPLLREKRSNSTPCGFLCESAAAAYLAGVADKLRRRRASKCSEFAVYSAALGAAFDTPPKFAPRDVANALPLEVLRRRGCYFRFVLADPSSSGKRKKTTGRVETVVPLDPARLPFGPQEMRRNVKVLKMLGHFLFPWATRLVWIDAKLRVGLIDPRDFFDATVERQGACAAYVGLPLHRNAYGDNHPEKPSLKRHAETIVNAARRRPSVTDNLTWVAAQMAHYAPGDGSLSRYLVDSAYFARDFRTERCRAFNEAFGCAWFDEIDCFSDRDQLAFPVAVHRLGLRPSGGRGGIVVDAQTKQPALFIMPPGTVRRPGPHWYFSNWLAIGKCVACAPSRRRRNPPPPQPHGNLSLVLAPTQRDQL